MRLLAVVAHPDDESFGCGSLLAHAAAVGYETSVLCATRGEAGESRIDTADLAAHRETELRDAARILGVRHVRLLDHRDSGMSGDPAPGTLTAAEPDVLAAEVRAVLDELRPDVVVTLDASDGHRDHAAIRDATLAAVESADDQPAATYLWCLARSSMARWADAHAPASAAATPTSHSPSSARPTTRSPPDRRLRPPPDALGGDPGPHEPGQSVRRPTRRAGSRVPRHRSAPARRRRGPVSDHPYMVTRVRRAHLDDQ